MELDFLKGHRISFVGKSNHLKAKVLLVLKDHPGLTHEQIALFSGCNPESVHKSMPKYHRWRYVTRRLVKVGPREMFVYSLGKRGFRFINQRMPDDIRKQLVFEMLEYRLQNRIRFYKETGGRGSRS